MDYVEFRALADIDAAYLKANYLTGFRFKDRDGQDLPAIFFEEKLQTALGVLEAETGVDVLRRVIVAERHDYHQEQYLEYAYLSLFRMPCLSVSEVRATFPDGAMKQVFPSEWIRLEKGLSQINLVPIGGTIAQIQIGRGGFYPLIWFSEHLPHLWEVDYVSGFDPDKIPRIIIEALCKLAALDALQVLSDLVGPLGVASQSLAVDGLSQSRGHLFPAFKARIDQYKADLRGVPGIPGTGLLAQIRSQFYGVRVTAA